MNIFEKIGKTPQETVKSPVEGKSLEEKVKDQAYLDAEIEIGGENPKNKYQRGSLSASDVGYMEKVQAKVKEELNDNAYIEKTKQDIEKNSKPSDFKSNDEGYKSGHGILENHNQAA